MKPYEYYKLSPYEFFAMTEGYFDKQDRSNRRARAIAHQIHWAHVDQKDYKRQEEFWPIWNDEKNLREIPSLSITSQAVVDEIMKAQNLPPVKVKNK